MVTVRIVSGDVLMENAYLFVTSSVDMSSMCCFFQFPRKINLGK